MKTSRVHPRVARFVAFDALSGSEFSQTKQYETGLKVDGVSNRDYKKLIASGLSATTKYDKSLTTFVSVPSSFEASGIYTGLRGLCYGLPFHYNNTELYVPPSVYDFVNPPPELLKARNLAYAVIYNKIRKHQQNIEGMTALGELRETLNMLRSPFAALRKRTGLFIDRAAKLKSYKQANKPRLRRQPDGSYKRDYYRVPNERFLNDLGQTWLEFSFGAQPLLSDIADIADLAIQARRFDISRLTARATEQFATSSFKTNGLGRIEFDYYVNYSGDFSVNISAGVRNDIQSDMSPLGRLRSRSGIKLSELLNTGYELTPYSWLLDYVSNVGDVVAALTTNTSAVAWSSVTEVINQEQEFVSVGLRSVDDRVGFGSWRKTPYARGTRTTISRTSGLPPIPEVAFDFRLNAGQGLNILALAATYLKPLKGSI